MTVEADRPDSEVKEGGRVNLRKREGLGIEGSPFDGLVSLLKKSVAGDKAGATYNLIKSMALGGVKPKPLSWKEFPGMHYVPTQEWAVRLVQLAAQEIVLEREGERAFPSEKGFPIGIGTKIVPEAERILDRLGLFYDGEAGVVVDRNGNVGLDMNRVSDNLAILRSVWAKEKKRLLVAGGAMVLVALVSGCADDPSASKVPTLVPSQIPQVTMEITPSPIPPKDVLLKLGPEATPEASGAYPSSLSLSEVREGLARVNYTTIDEFSSDPQIQEMIRAIRAKREKWLKDSGVDYDSLMVIYATDAKNGFRWDLVPVKGGKNIAAWGMYGDIIDEKEYPTFATDPGHDANYIDAAWIGYGLPEGAAGSYKVAYINGFWILTRDSQWLNISSQTLEWIEGAPIPTVMPPTSTPAPTATEAPKPTATATEVKTELQTIIEKLGLPDGNYTVEKIDRVEGVLVRKLNLKVLRNDAGEIIAYQADWGIWKSLSEAIAEIEVMSGGEYVDRSSIPRKNVWIYGYDTTEVLDVSLTVSDNKGGVVGYIRMANLYFLMTESGLRPVLSPHTFIFADGRSYTAANTSKILDPEDVMVIGDYSTGPLNSNYVDAVRRKYKNNHELGVGRFYVVVDGYESFVSGTGAELLAAFKNRTVVAARNSLIDSAGGGSVTYPVWTENN